MVDVVVASGAALETFNRAITAASSTCAVNQTFPSGVTASELGTGLPADNFQVGYIERMPFPDVFADVVICSSVLHFARDEEHFSSMLTELWRVLRPEGMLFCRLGSRIGMDFERVSGGRFVVGDGSVWFLVDEEMLMEYSEKMDCVLVDPLKTTIVQDYRCMTTWVLRKRR